MKNAAMNGRPTTKFWDTVDHRTRREATALVNENPAMLAILSFASWYAWEAWQKKLMITSVWRTHLDPHGMHERWRAVDCRVYEPMRDGGDESKVITRSEWKELVGVLNDTFRYGRTWTGRKTNVAILREPNESDHDTAVHVHIQTPRRHWR